MRAYLARTGLAVFAMLFAITLLTEHIADGRALVASANAAVDLPQLREVAIARVTERGATRGDDRFSEAAMEDRKREGYF